jgi:predicted RNA-binding Zn-ribbon protein involved in translation (DUF1610 family)
MKPSTGVRPAHGIASERPAEATPSAVAAGFDVIFVCPDCRAHIDHRITAIRRVETFRCVDGCGHVFKEPPELWVVALALLRPIAIGAS